MQGDHMIAQAVRKLESLERKIQDSQRHLQFLHTADFIDARELQKLAGEFSVGAMAMEEYLARVAGDAETLIRRFPARPFRNRNFSQQEALDARLASSVGLRNQVRALARRIPQELDELHNGVMSLAKKADAGMKDPGRWGDLAATAPINDLIGFISAALDLFDKWARKKRSEAK